MSEEVDDFAEVRERNRAATAAAQAAGRPTANAVAKANGEPLSYAEGALRAAEAQERMNAKIAAIVRPHMPPVP